MATLTLSFLGPLAFVGVGAAGRSDADALQGVWSVEERQVRFGGKVAPSVGAESDLKPTVEIKADVMTFGLDPRLAAVPTGQATRWKFTLGKEKGKKQIDLVALDGLNETGTTAFGIYKLEGDVLHLFMAKGKERPAGFDAKPLYSTYLTLKRVKK